MKDFGILPDFAGIAVTDRYGNYFHPRGRTSPAIGLRPAHPA